MSVEKTPSGRYRAVVRFQGRREHSQPFDTLDEARLAEADLLVRIGAGKTKVRIVRLSAMIERLFETRKYSPSTMSNYRRLVDRVIPQSLLRTDVSDLTPKRIDLELAKIENPFNRQKALQIVSGALKLAARDDLVPVNVTTVLSVELPPAPRITIPSDDEVRSMIEFALPQWKAFIHAAATLGARRGELLALRWDRFIDDEVIIEQAVVKGDRITLGDVKTGRSGHRRITVDQGTLERINELPRRSEWVFDREVAPGHFSYRRPDSATKMFVRLMDDLAMDYNFHSLRHYMATKWLSAGVPPNQVAYRLGHSSVNMVMRVYGHWIPARDRDAAQQLAL